MFIWNLCGICILSIYVYLYLSVFVFVPHAFSPSVLKLGAAIAPVTTCLRAPPVATTGLGRRRPPSATAGCRSANFRLYLFVSLHQSAMYMFLCIYVYIYIYIFIGMLSSQKLALHRTLGEASVQNSARWSIACLLSFTVPPLPVVTPEV